jgi:hypothetical protein
MTGATHVHFDRARLKSVPSTQATVFADAADQVIAQLELHQHND